MKRLLSLICLFGMLVSCASSRRMARVWKEKTTETEKEPDRTNFFPLFYVSGTSSSVLWPLIDSDKHGVSVRPVFNKEGDEYAILFPFSAWNPVQGDGWIGPYYWDQDKAALIPIYYKSKDLLQFLNFYKTDKSSGLFPVYHLSDNSFYVLGLYGRSDYPQYSNHSFLFGLLSDFDYWKNGRVAGHFLNYYTDRSDSKSTNVFFPLYFSTETAEGDDSKLVFPLFYKHSNPNGDKGFYTLLGGSSKEGDQTNSSIALLWWSGKGKNSEYKTLVPLFSMGHNPNEEYLYLFPWYSSKGKHGDSQSLFPLYSFSSHKNEKNELTRSSWSAPWILPLVSNCTTENSSKTESLYGMLFSHKTRDSSTEGSVLGFLVDWNKDSDSSRFRFPALFNLTGIVDISQSEEKSKVNLLLYSHEKTPEMTRRDIFPFITWDSGEKENGFSFLWRVFEKHERNGKKGGHIFFIPWGV